MKQQPWLSVLIPTYNGAKYLPAALDSIVAQKDSNIECIVVDDGSTDITLSILSTYEKKLNIKFFQRQRQGNWVVSTNYALSLATGEFICFLHQDDLWLKNRLSTLRSLTNQFPKINFFLSSAKFINTKGNSIGLWKCPLPSFPTIIKPNIMIEKLLIQNFISIPTPIFRREAALLVGGLDESLWYTADWDLWLKIAAKSESMYYPKPLSGFRIHDNSQTIKRSTFPQNFREQLENVVKKHLSAWNNSESAKKETEKIARFSIEVNISLANMFHKNGNQLIGLSRLFLQLGFTKEYRYLRDSRILERVFARVRAQLGNNHNEL